MSDATFNKKASDDTSVKCTISVIKGSSESRYSFFFAHNQLKSQQFTNEWRNVTLGDIFPLCFVEQV